MASTSTAAMVGVIAFFLTPGVFISIPPGPNKKWLFGGQVTWFNAAVHAAVIGIVVFYFVQ
jgi:hypothetical protein